MSKPILLKEFLQKKNKLKKTPQETPVGTTGLLLVYIYINKNRMSVCLSVTMYCKNRL